MSKETSEWLNQNVLIGFTEKRGEAWHYRKSDQGVEPNHYPGAIPLGDVDRRLFFWTPEEAEITVALKDQPGHPFQADRHKAIVRPDTRQVLGIVGSGYTIHPYGAWLLDNVDALLGKTAGIGSAGLLDGGARSWVQVETPETCTTPEGVSFRPFLTAATSLDGSMSTTYHTGAQVVVCDNTLSVALREKDAATLKIRHSSKSALNVTNARQALDLLEATTESFAAEVKAQHAVPVSNEVWKRFVYAYFPLKNESSSTSQNHPQFKRRLALTQLWMSDPRVAPWNGTAYGVLAAVNTYQHHVALTVGSRSRAERNAHRALNGDIASIDAKTRRTLAAVL